MKKKSIILSSIACSVVLVVAIVAVVSMNEPKKVDIESQPAETVFQPTIESSSMPTVSTTVKPKVETTTKKVSTTKAETTTKKVTTTKAETTTKKTTEVTFDGHKPYEVFTDPVSGNKVYYDENGIRYVAEAMTAAPGGDYDNSYCHECGSKDCIQAMNPYHCTVCDKDIPALTCHAKSHYEASH